MPELKEDALKQLLFASQDVDSSNVFALIDGAASPEIIKQIYSAQPEHFCLLTGELAPDMIEVAPYLVKLESGAEFTDWLTEECWGKSWCVFARTHADLQQMRKHFRSLLTVYDPQREPMMFRYYDPRVLRIFLPTCTKQELATMFGAVDGFLLEAEDASKWLLFSRADGTLKCTENNLQAG